MKTSKKLNLSNLSKKEVEESKAGYTGHCVGSQCCGCGCYWANAGGSTTEKNDSANFDQELFSPVQ